MKRAVAVLAVLAGLAAPAVASAHTALPPHLSCGELDGSFHGFPAGPNAVTLHYSVDGVPQPDVTLTGTGPDFDVSTGYYNRDAGAHVVQAQWTWTADGGGSSSIVSATIGNCPAPASQQDIQNLQVQITNLSVVIRNVTNRVDTISCTSSRIYRFLIRTEINGSSVVSVDRGLVRNQAEFWSVTRVARDGRQRFQVAADYRGLEVPAGQVRTVTTFVTTADGHHYRTVQKLRLCLDRDGNMQDTSSQGRNRL